VILPEAAPFLSSRRRRTAAGAEPHDQLASEGEVPAQERLPGVQPPQHGHGIIPHLGGSDRAPRGRWIVEGCRLKLPCARESDFIRNREPLGSDRRDRPRAKGSAVARIAVGGRLRSRGSSRQGCMGPRPQALRWPLFSWPASLHRSRDLAVDTWGPTSGRNSSGGRGPCHPRKRDRRPRKIPSRKSEGSESPPLRFAGGSGRQGFPASRGSRESRFQQVAEVFIGPVGARLPVPPPRDHDSHQ
jgi:hypothetical protein